MTLMHRLPGSRAHFGGGLAGERRQLRRRARDTRHVVAVGDSGTTVDPLQYNCGNDAPTCGQVGESYGYYNGTNVDLLYSENYYCDTAVPSHAATGCEVGAGPSSPDPTAPSPDGTSLGNTTHGDTLYIPVPAVRRCATHPVHGHGHLRRPSTDHRPVGHRRGAAG